MHWEASGNWNGPTGLPGGDINQAALLTDGTRKWFLKYHHNAPDGMFEAEAQALAETAQQDCIRVPAPIAYGKTGNTDWLVLEYLELSVPRFRSTCWVSSLQHCTA